MYQHFKKPQLFLKINTYLALGISSFPIIVESIATHNEGLLHAHLILVLWVLLTSFLYRLAKSFWKPQYSEIAISTLY